MVYPIVSALPFFLAKRLGWRSKFIGMAVPSLACGLFILYTGNKYKELTGTWQYSPFSGWQAANNAMYVYRYVDSSKRKPVPEKFKQLDRMVREYFDSTRDVSKYPAETLKANTFYMWSSELPLFRYRERVLANDSTSSELKRWSLMGPLYKEYGIFILKQYPVEFLEHFAWPNAVKYYAPPAEFMEEYNMGYDSVSDVAQKWFRYSSTHVFTRVHDKKAYPLMIYPILIGTTNVALLCSLICFIILKGHRYIPRSSRTLLLVSIVWFLNAVFTIASSPAAIRLQAFPMLLEFTFAILLISWMLEVGKYTKIATKGPNFDPFKRSLQPS